MCELAGVSRSGFYRWIETRKAREAREQKDFQDFQYIKQAYDYRGYAKGSRGISMRLKRMGNPMNRKKIQRLMRKYHLVCPIRKENPYRKMVREMRTDIVAPNQVNREFRLHGPRRILLTDITYLKLNSEHIYLSVIKDAFTMQVLSYQVSISLKVDFVIETVTELIQIHGEELDGEVLIHSDQGCHYTSIEFRSLLTNLQIAQSMSRRGNCWDNAPQESFFGHMKDELKPYIKGWQTIEDVKERIDDYMDYYNNDRYQSLLGGMSPNEYYHYLVTGLKPSALTD